MIHIIYVCIHIYIYIYIYAMGARGLQALDGGRVQDE